MPRRCMTRHTQQASVLVAKFFAVNCILPDTEVLQPPAFVFWGPQLLTVVAVAWMVEVVVVGAPCTVVDS